MDNNLLGITTLAQQQSKTPLVTGGKSQQLINGNMNSDQFDNNMSHSRLEGLSTVDYNNSKRSPFRSTYRNGIDESSDNISRAQSNYDNFGSPGLNKSLDKTTGKAKLQQQLGAANNQQQNNNMYSTFGSQSTAQPGQSAQRQSHQHLNYASPDKTNARSARKGSNAKSARSNSSIESTDRNGSARRSVNRVQNSASRRRSSYSGTDQDSQERSFTYPCQAFKQFLLAVREGKIDMKDLNNSPFLIDYLTMQAQIGGGGSGGAGGDKNFANSLRSSTASNRSGSKNNRDNSNKKNRRQSNLGESMRAPRDSIIEEEEDDNVPAVSSQNKAKNHNFNSNGSANAANKNPQNAQKRIPSPQKTQSPMKPQRQAPTSSGNPSQGTNLAKHNFKEDSNKAQSNISPLKGQQQQPSSQPQNKQQTSPDKNQRQRRGRNDRSTSGDEGRGGQNSSYGTTNPQKGGDQQDNNSNDVVDLRFDEKGRPIKNNASYNTGMSNKKPVNTKQNLNENSDDDKLTQGGGDYNTTNTNNGKSGKKNRRGRGDRDSSVSSSVDQYENLPSSTNINPYSKDQSKTNKLTSSPNEPRSISNLPKPTEKDQLVRQSQQNNPGNNNTMLPIIDERLNTNDEDGTFREYQNSQRTGNDGGDTGRLIIFDKNTDFKTDQDYELNALKDNQTKKYLKSKASPLKKQQFREDEEDVFGGASVGNNNDDGDNNVIDLADDDVEDANNSQSNILNTNDNNNDDNSQSDGYNNRQSSYQDPVVGNSITMMKKTPSRESRKVKSHSQFNPSNTGNNQYQTPQDSTIRGGDQTNGGAALGNSVGGDDLGLQSNKGGNTNKSNNYNNYLDSQLNQGSPIKGGGNTTNDNRSRTNKNNLSNKNMQNNSQNSLQQDSDFYNDNYNSVNNPTMDRPMHRNDLEDSDLNDRDSQLAITRNQSSADKKQRRGRANRSGGGNQSSEVSMERGGQPLEARHFDSASRNQLQDGKNNNLQSQNGKSPSKSPMKSQKSPSKSNRHNQQQDNNDDEDNDNIDVDDDGHQLTIEEHLDTFRSKNSSQVNYAMKSHRTNNSNDQDDNNDSDYDKADGQSYQQDQSNRNNNNKSGNKSNSQSPMKSVKSRNTTNNNNGDKTFKSMRDNANDSDDNIDNYNDYNNDQSNRNNINNISGNNKSNTNSPMKSVHSTRNNNNNGDKSHKSMRNNNNNDNYGDNNGDRSNRNNNNTSSNKKRYHDQDQDDDAYDQDRSQSNLNSGRQESSRYQDEYSNPLLNSSRKDQNDRKRENRRSNNNNTITTAPINYSQNQYDGGKSNKSRNNNNIDNNGNTNDDDNMRQSQRSLTNLANTNYDEYNYSSFGQQNQQNDDNNGNNNSTGKKQRRKRGSRERSNDGNGGSNDDEQQQRSSQIKSSIQPLRGSRLNNAKDKNYSSNNNPNNNDNKYQTQYSSNYNDRNSNNNTNSDNDEQKLKQSLQKYQSKLKELEDKLKKQVQDDPNKPLDYRLIQEINDEAARTIQMQYRLKKLQKKQKEDAGQKHGNLVDRMVQTEPMNQTSFGQSVRGPNGQFDLDKFKRFFFAVFYTYMMMNTIMADVFKRQQPLQTNNQWNEQDYKDYLNRRNNNNSNSKK